MRAYWGFLSAFLAWIAGGCGAFFWLTMDLLSYFFERKRDQWQLFYIRNFLYLSFSFFLFLHSIVHSSCHLSSPCVLLSHSLRYNSIAYLVKPRYAYLPRYLPTWTSFHAFTDCTPEPAHSRPMLVSKGADILPAMKHNIL